MVAVKLNGGLGNQMFQAAAAYSLALMNNDYFMPVYEKADEATRPHYFRHLQCIKENNLYTENIYNEPSFSYQPIPFSMQQDRICLNGYFQSEKYFKRFGAEIKHLFTAPILANNFEKGKVAIHVRRGDYLEKPGYHPFVGEEWLHKAVMYFYEKGYRHFYIISDAVDWCRLFFMGIWHDLNVGFEYSSNPHPLLDMYAAAGCEHIIGANSSFSWWAAWLNPNPGKICYFPKNWFGPAAAEGVTADDIYCDGWIVI